MNLPLSDLDRRLSRAIEQGRGIRLSDADLDLLAASGAYDTLHTAAGEALREQAKCRDVQRRRGSISAVPTGWNGTDEGTGAYDPPSSQSSGTIPPGRASEALQRAREMSGRPARPLIATTSRTQKAKPSAPLAGNAGQQPRQAIS